MQAPQAKLTEVRDMRPEAALSRLRLAVVYWHDVAAFNLDRYGKRDRRYRDAIREEARAEKRFRLYKSLRCIE